MIYDKLLVALLAMLSTEEETSANAQIARHLLKHANDISQVSVKSIASACHVGTGTVSRFARDAGFSSFAELRDTFRVMPNSFELVALGDNSSRASALARVTCASITQAATSVDNNALMRLIADLHSFGEVGTYGLLKAQAAALDLQVDLLTLGKLVDTSISVSDQTRRISEAGPDKLVIIFSYTGTYFDAVDVADAMRRINRPKIWLVCGEERPYPSFVADRLLFSSDHSRLGHPYQLEYMAGLIAQEYAATLEGSS